MVEGAQPSLEAVAQVAAHAGPLITGQSLDAELFEKVEQRTFHRVFRLVRPVQRGVRP